MIKKLFSILILFAISHVVQAEMSASQRYLYLRPLVGQHPIEFYAGAFLIEKDGVQDPALLDVAAERLALELPKVDFSIFSSFDPVNRVINTLGNSGNPRYHTFLTKLASTVSEKRTLRHFEKALTNIDASTENQFIAGTVDLDALRGRLGSQLNESKPQKEGSLLSIAEGTSLDSVLMDAGLPDTVTAGVGLKILFGIDLVYYGKGNVRLRYDSAKGWKVHIIMNELAHSAIDDSLPSAAMAHRLMLENPRLFLGAAHFLSQLPKPDQQVLDAAAHRIWLSRMDSDGDSKDGIKFLVKIFRSASDPRYKSFFKTLAESEPTSLAGKYAEKISAETPATDIPQFTIR